MKLFLRNDPASPRFQWIQTFVLPFLTLVVFSGGALLLFSGSIPDESSRLAELGRLIPLPVIEISHFLASLLGVGLLLVAWGLERRIDAAYGLAVVFLAAGTVLSLLKGLNYEISVALAAFLTFLAPFKNFYYRRASFIQERFTKGWAALITLAITSSVLLGYFSYSHVEYSDSLWWRFTLNAQAPRFMRASVGALIAVLVFALARLLAPARPSKKTAHSSELEAAREILKHSGPPSARLALLGDKTFLFSENRQAFLMYGVRGKSWVALGDPVGPEAEWPALIRRFRETGDRYEGWTIFKDVRRENLSLYLDIGLSVMKTGEEARVPLASFDLEDSRLRSLRYMHRRLEKEGCRFRLVPAGEGESFLPALKAVSDDWLIKKKTHEKRFSLGFFQETYLKECPLALVERDGQIIAFANVLLGAGQREISADLMRYLPDAAPSSVMEFLFIELMRWAKAEGFGWFSLGLAPLSGLEAGFYMPWPSRVASMIYSHGERFYHFRGLRQYKEKYHPVWEPRYLASPGGLALPRMFADMAGLISTRHLF